MKLSDMIHKPYPNEAALLQAAALLEDTVRATDLLVVGIQSHDYKAVDKAWSDVRSALAGLMGAGLLDEDTKAGPEPVDALVAEKVMGWKRADTTHLAWLTPDGLVTHEATSFGRFMPSLYIEDAWRVVEKMRSEEVRWEIILPGHEVWAWLVPDDNYIGKHDYVSGTAPAAPLAICLAALKAVGYEIPS